MKKNFNVGIIGDRHEELVEHILLNYGGPCHFSVEMPTVSKEMDRQSGFTMSDEEKYRIDHLMASLDNQAYVQYSRNRAEFEKEGVRVYQVPTAAVYGLRARLHEPIDFACDQSKGLYRGLFEENFDIVFDTGLESDIQRYFTEDGLQTQEIYNVADDFNKVNTVLESYIGWSNRK